ncbi:MAG: hypothetical protein ABI175_06170 [Polyangiales bacterium]
MSDPLDAQTKQVADAYWGGGPQQPAKRDAHGLGPPPRALTIGMGEYVKRAGASLFGLWVTLAVLFALGDAITIAAMKGLVAPPLSIAFVVAAVVSYRKRAELRRRIARVCEEGNFATAVVKNIHQVQTRRYVTTTITYRVEGAPRDVHLVSRDQAVTFLQVGLRDEVLWLAAEPDVCVPTFLVA